MAKSNNLLKIIIDAETGERGYLITGETRFLEPYFRSLQVFEANFVELKNLVRDNPQQQKLLGELHDTHDGWLRYAQKVMEMKRMDRDFSGYVSSGAGKALMDSIRQQFDKLNYEEEKLRTERTQATDRITRIAIVSIFGVLLGLGLTVVIFGRRQLIVLSEEYNLLLRSVQSERDKYSKVAAIITNSDDAIISTDLTGNIQSWNMGAQRLFGYMEEEVLSRSMVMLLPPDRQSEEETILARIRAGIKIDHFETSRLTKDRRQVPVSVTASPVTDGRGHVIGASKIVRELTERLRIEEANIRYAKLLQFAPDAIFIWRFDTGIEHWNHSCEQLFGFKADEAIGQNSHHLLKTEEPCSWQEIESVMRKKDLWEGDLVQWTKDGRRLMVSARLQLSKSDDGIEHVLESNHDITERKQAEIELRDAKTAAENAAKSRAVFLDIAAHELRTPVTIFSMMIQLAQKQLEKGQPVSTTSLVRLKAASDRLTRLVVDLLEVSRLERGMVTIHSSPSDLVSLVSTCIDEFQHLSPLRHFIFTKPDHPIEVHMDSVRINQVLSNLIDNSIKYTPEANPIEIKIDPMPDRIRVSVIDLGTGISIDKQSGLFHAFSRGDSDQVQKTPGLGLGLSICRGIIELHGGTMGVSSEPDRGSIFYFEIPRKGSLEWRAQSKKAS